MTLFDDLKHELKSWQSFAQVISGLVIIVSGAFSFLFKFLNSFIPKEYLNLSRFVLVYIGIAILLWKITGILINKRISSLLVTSDSENVLYKYSKDKRLIAKSVRWILVGLIPVFFIFGFIIKKNREEMCLNKRNKVGISVSKFSSSKPDEFSTNLINFLDEETSNDSTLVLEFNDKFIGINASLSPRDSLIPLINCYNRGFVIFGSRNKYEENFYCNIFINNESHLPGKIRLVGDTMFRIMEPELIKFDIISQAKTVGKFVLSQIYYQRGEYKLSLEVLDDILLKDSLQLNNQLKSQSYLLKGNNLFQIGDFQSANISYESGYLADNKNELLKLNVSAVRKALEIKEEEDKRESGINISQKDKHFIISNEEGEVFADGEGNPIRYKNWVIFPYQGKWCAVISINGRIREVIHKGNSVDVIKDSLDKF